MLRKTIFLGFAALLVTLAMSSRAHAWGVYHAGWTHVGPAGVYHVGGTRAYGGYGGVGYGGYHYGYYHPYGGYHYGYYRRW
ncbi:MAG TPA: hypothetical protein VGG61_16210 [Gemmataceae bacterium]|jgi:hypothetical protein